MAGMTRRRFLRLAGALAASRGLPGESVAALAAEAPAPSDALTTLQATIVPGPAASPERYGSGLRAIPPLLRSRYRYHTLKWGPGEPFVERDDLGVGPSAGRAKTRRSLLYLSQITDLHIVDAQTPARLEYLLSIDRSQNTGAFRPQETLTAHVLAQMVLAVNEASTSPVTGAPLALALVTGDLCDGHNLAELRWAIDVLDGGDVLANTGKPRVYEGVQRWPHLDYSFYPDDPAANPQFRGRLFPPYPGLLAFAVSEPVRSQGLRAPWLSLPGNHDVHWQGSHPVTPLLGAVAAADRKASRLPGYALVTALAGQFDGRLSEAHLEMFWDHMSGPVARKAGMHAVAPDRERRRVISLPEWVEEHFVGRSRPGPPGHGFDPVRRGSGETHWVRDVGPGVRVVGLDTTNHHAGPNGCLTDSQFHWLEARLAEVSSRSYDSSGNLVTAARADRLVVVASHHPSWAMGNTQPDPNRLEVMHSGKEVRDLLLRYPNVVVWVNGHVHEHRIRPFRSPHEAGAGLWEVNTASCIDFPQQSRLVELVDNRDGTLSVFTVVLDHKGAPQTPGLKTGPAGAAPEMAVAFRQEDTVSVSRELAANRWFDVRWGRRGERGDRNCELVVKAPFDLSLVPDHALEAHKLTARVNLGG